MEWHRELTAEDVGTAHLLLEQHQPIGEFRAGRERTVCANALHTTAPAWPCDRTVWAHRVLDAARRGVVAGVDER